MPSIRTYASPVSNQVTIDIPREYASYSFEILLMPVRHERKKMGFVEFLRSAQVEEGELDLTRNHQDYPREVALCEMKGLKKPSVDSLIAVSAVSEGLTLVTRNVTDMANLGAVIFNPWDGKYTRDTE